MDGPPQSEVDGNRVLAAVMVRYHNEGFVAGSILPAHRLVMVKNGGNPEDQVTWPEKQHLEFHLEKVTDVLDKEIIYGEGIKLNR
jgi:hypothetical protein